MGFFRSLFGETDAFKEMVAAHQKVALAQAEAAKAQAESLKEYFALFKVTASPQVRTTRDSDEWKAELQRKGLTKATEQEKLAHILRQSSI